jgi:hypothetical protein
MPFFFFQPSPDFDNKAPFDVMSKAALRTLGFLASQYRGANNGDLSIAPKVCKPYGIPRSTARKGVAELAYLGLVVETRRGGLNLPALYGLTWLGLDEEVSFKFDEGITASEKPLEAWTMQYRHLRTRHLAAEHEANVGRPSNPPSLAKSAQREKSPVMTGDKQMPHLPSRGTSNVVRLSPHSDK